MAAWETVRLREDVEGASDGEALRSCHALRRDDSVAIEAKATVLAEAVALAAEEGERQGRRAKAARIRAPLQNTGRNCGRSVYITFVGFQIQPNPFKNIHK